MKAKKTTQVLLATMLVMSTLLSACFPPPPPPLEQPSQNEVSQAEPPVASRPQCQTRTISIQPNNMTLIPRKIRGDREFDGHGPQYTVRATLLVTESEVSVELYMIAEETRSDWSTAEGTRVESVYFAGPNEKIIGVLTATHSSISDTDRDHAVKEHHDQGLVSVFYVMGDSSGDDIETDTGVTAVYRPVQIQLMETGNCVEP